jgi:hypothetical protein
MEGIFEIDETEGSAGNQRSEVITCGLNQPPRRSYSTQFVVTTEDAGALEFNVEGQGVEASVNIPNMPETD